MAQTVPECRQREVEVRLVMQGMCFFGDEPGLGHLARARTVLERGLIAGLG